MKVYLMTAGTRGDVEPFVALGVALRAAGHDAWLAAGASLAPLARDRGLPFHEVRTDLFAMIDDPDAAKALRNPLAAMKLIPALRPKVREMLDDLEIGAHGADVIVAAPKAIAGVHLAELMRVPVLLAAPTPMVVPTSAFPLPGVPVPPSRLFNRLSYRAQRAAVRPFRKEIVSWRHAHDLDGDWDPMMIHGTPPHVIYAFSAAIVPPPDDWKGRATVTGAWGLTPTTGWHPPADLARFVEASPVVSIGFGSMPMRDPAQMLATIGRAVDDAGCRAVIITGKSGIVAEDMPESCFLIDAVPHSWLFDRVAAVVHHGGAGTTHSGLAAGRPTLMAPVFGDQPFWARQVHRLGAGPAPIPVRKLDRKRLARALAELVGNESYARRAHELSSAISLERGTDAAVDIIESQQVR